MSGTGQHSCRMPSSWNCKMHFVVVCARVRCMDPSELDPGDSNRLSKGRQKVRLDNVCTAHSQPWDERLGKRSSRHPDLRHRRASKYFRLHSSYKPLLVISRLTTLDSGEVRSLSRRPGLELIMFCEEGQLEKALGTMYRMDELGTVPSVDMYRCLLKACSKKRALTQAKQVHAHLAKNGLELTRFLGESVVSTFVKCGGLEDALQVFQKLPDRTVVSWTAMISGYTSSGQGQEALRMYHRMKEEGVKPGKYTFASLLKACGSVADLEEGRRIHADAVTFECELELFVGTCLIDMYAKCGSIMDAQHVFDRLLQRDVVSWNAMLAGYAQMGQGEKALELYRQMQKEGISADDRTFVSALQACGSLAENEESSPVDGQLLKVKSLGVGEAIHAEARKRGYESDVFVASTLVSMYGKCGSIVHAQDVFTGLSHPNVVSWNAMLATYTQQDQAEKALQLFSQMREERVRPNARTFVSVIQACGMVADNKTASIAGGLKPLEMGKALHAEAGRMGFGGDIFVANALISMYGKCGSLVNAQEVFDGLSQRDVVSWNAILMTYVEHGLAEEALELYAQMLVEGVSPDNRTYVPVLQVCGMTAERDEHVKILEGQSTRVESFLKGQAIHAEAWKRGFQSDPFVGSALVGMYVKCGSMVDAQSVFDGLSHQDGLSWNAMVAGYAQGQGEKAWQLYQKMRQEGISANDRTFVSALQACGSLAETEEGTFVSMQFLKVDSLTRGKALHAEASTRGYLDVFVNSTLVSVYGKCGSIVDAETVFRGLCQQNVVSWNVMLAAYLRQGKVEDALQLYGGMQEAGVSPDSRTFMRVIQACGVLADEEAGVLEGRSLKGTALWMGKAAHAEFRVLGFDIEAYVGSALISMYGKCGSILDAQNVFDELCHRDIVSWNAMLAAYGQDGQADQAARLYAQMMAEGFSPNETTYVCLLQASGNAGSLQMCSEIHHHLASTRTGLSLLLANSLIHNYGKCARMVLAQDVFNSLSQPDVVSWNALIAGYAREGDCEASFHYYEEMLGAGDKPNGVTFLSLLSACSHAGLAEKGVEYFDSMTKDHGINPDNEHYVCIVDLLGRGGYFSVVEILLSHMPIEPDLPMCLCLLNACRKHGNVVLAERAFQWAVALQPSQGTAYLVMSTIYANAGLWDSAQEVEKRRQKAAAQRDCGQTWIQHDQETHVFVVGVCDHSMQGQICGLVTTIGLKLMNKTNNRHD